MMLREVASMPHTISAKTSVDPARAAGIPRRVALACGI